MVLHGFGGPLADLFVSESESFNSMSGDIVRES